MGFVLAVTWVAMPGEEERVAARLREVVPLARAEPGVLSWSAHRSVDDLRRFFLFEEYADEAALQAHVESAHVRRLLIGDALPRLERRERLAYRPL